MQIALFYLLLSAINYPFYRKELQQVAKEGAWLLRPRFYYWGSVVLFSLIALPVFMAFTLPALHDLWYAWPARRKAAAWFLRRKRKHKKNNTAAR